MKQNHDGITSLHGIHELHVDCLDFLFLYFPIKHVKSKQDEDHYSMSSVMFDWRFALQMPAINALAN